MLKGFKYLSNDGFKYLSNDGFKYLSNDGFKYLSVSLEGSLALILSTLGLSAFSFVGQS